MKQKVLAYITRCENAQLLVFDHRDYSEAGTQVPAGMVEDGEAVEVEPSGAKCGKSLGLRLGSYSSCANWPST